MLKNIYYLTVLLFVCAIVPSCSKKHVDTNPVGDAGTVEAKVNGAPYEQYLWHHATYYPAWKQLIVSVQGIKYDFSIHADIDPNTIPKDYSLQAFGDNSLSVQVSNFDMLDGSYASVDNIADIGGVFTITKFDTTTKRYSGTVHGVCYTLDRAKRITFDAVMTDNLLTTDNIAYDGNHAECTFVGNQTTTWHSIDLSSKVKCTVTAGSPGSGTKVLAVEMYNVAGVGESARALKFTIPVKPAGSYPISTGPLLSCDPTIVSSQYSIYLDNYKFNPTSGTLQILSVDPTAKTLHASFNMTMKNADRNETIQVTNGNIETKWQE